LLIARRLDTRQEDKMESSHPVFRIGEVIAWVEKPRVRLFDLPDGPFEITAVQTGEKTSLSGQDISNGRTIANFSAHRFVPVAL